MQANSRSNYPPLTLKELKGPAFILMRWSYKCEDFAAVKYWKGHRSMKQMKQLYNYGRIET